MDDAELDEIERRSQAVLSAPWKSFIEGRGHQSGSNFIQTAGVDIELIGATLEDQDFIARSKDDVDRLIKEIRFLKKQLAKLQPQKT